MGTSNNEARMQAEASFKQVCIINISLLFTFDKIILPFLTLILTSFSL